MQFNDYIKRNIRLIAITVAVSTVLMLGLLRIGDLAQNRTEASEYAAYDSFCAENDLRFFEGLEFFPLSSERSGASVSSDYLSRLIATPGMIADLKARNTNLLRQAELAIEVIPPSGVRFLHQELIIRLRTAADFGEILVLAARADATVDASGSVSLDWPTAELTNTAAEYFDSLYRVLFLMDIVEAEALDKVPACASFADYDRRSAGRYVAWFRSLFSRPIESSSVPIRTILVEPDRAAESNTPDDSTSSSEAGLEL